MEKNEILVRNGKGQKDRHTMLSGVAKELLPEHLRRIKETHELDLRAGAGRAYCQGPWNANIPMPIGSGAGNIFFQPRRVFLTNRPAFRDGIIFMSPSCSGR